MATLSARSDRNARKSARPSGELQVSGARVVCGATRERSQLHGTHSSSCVYPGEVQWLVSGKRTECLLARGRQRNSTREVPRVRRRAAAASGSPRNPRVLNGPSGVGADPLGTVETGLAGYGLVPVLVRYRGPLDTDDLVVLTVESQIDTHRRAPVWVVRVRRRDLGEQVLSFPGC